MDGTFSGECFTEWFEKVKEICQASGHLEVALISIGQVLIHTPPDTDGLWIHRSVATALNDREADDLRAGFRAALFNRRGIQWGEPSSDYERQRAVEMRSEAEEVENAGFHRSGVMLKEVADRHDRTADSIIASRLSKGGKRG